MDYFKGGYKMGYNKCDTCGAKDGRCGLLIKTAEPKVSECLNCHDTRERGEIVIHSNLIRTEDELNRTFSILDESGMKISLVTELLRDEAWQCPTCGYWFTEGETECLDCDINKTAILDSENNVPSWKENA
jgi:hypothetical protein